MKRKERISVESLDIVRENIEALKSLFPEAATEAGIDFEVLRQLLGEEVTDGGGGR